MLVDLSEHVEHPPAMHVNAGPVTLISTFRDLIHLLRFPNNSHTVDSGDQ